MEMNFIESNPIPVKWALARMGLLQPVYRLPMVPPSHASRERIDAVLRECGLPLSWRFSDCNTKLKHCSTPPRHLTRPSTSRSLPDSKML